MSVKGITVTVGSKTVSGVYSDPVDYWELVDGGSLADVEIRYEETGASDSVIYTAFYPNTTTGRIGNYTEYVCEYKSGRYSVTKINTSGDGTTYIPVNGFVLSLNSTSHPSFAKVGDTVKLGGSSLTIPTKAVESTAGTRVVIDASNVKRSKAMVVYYDHQYGEKTGTNIYGTEMICEYDNNQKGFVVTGFRNFLSGDASGSAIPANGFVLSAYGEGYRQLLVRSELFKVGDVVKTVGFSFVGMSNSAVNSTYNSLSSRLTSVSSSAQTRITQLYDVDVGLINSYISEAKATLSELNSLKSSISSTTGDEKTDLLMEFSSKSVLLEELCDKILICSAESRVVSARSAWHRPCEKNYSEIETNVKMFHETGINLLFVETFYHGCSAFKSDVTDFPYHPSLASSYKDTKKNIVYNDYLSAFVACCKEYGIEVHAWVENFYVGIDQNSTLLQNHPDWIMYNDDGSILQRNEGGLYIFIDPANPDVQNTLIAYYNDLFEKHPDIVGLNLDYIRYPVSSKSQDTGYTKSAMIGFYSSLGKEFTSAQLSDRTKMVNKFLQLFNKDYLIGGQTEADSNYKKWVQYRTDVITEFVRRIKNEVKDPNKIILSTAVFASLSESLDSKKQDWQSWFKNGWIDIATPMAYYTDYSVVKSRVETMISLGGNNCLYYTGIASSYSGLPAWQNKEFIEASFNAGASGYVIFSSAQIVGHTDVQFALGGGVNSRWAVLPHGDIGEILNATFADILDKVDRIYMPAGGVTASGRQALSHSFDSIIGMPYENAYQIYMIQQAVAELTNRVVKSSASGYSYQRIADEISYLSDILDARVSIQLIGEGKWDPELNSTRPEIKDDYPVIPDHICKSVCAECGKCLDAECTEDACADKCRGHIPPHACEHVCAECGKCLDANCSETSCASKCEGHIPPTPPDTSDDPDDKEDEGMTDEGESDNSHTPDISDGDEGEEKLGFFARIWRAIANFFRRLFGRKK